MNCTHINLHPVGLDRGWLRGLLYSSSPLSLSLSLSRSAPSEYRCGLWMLETYLKAAPAAHYSRTHTHRHTHTTLLCCCCFRLLFGCHITLLLSLLPSLSLSLSFSAYTLYPPKFQGSGCNRGLEA